MDAGKLKLLEQYKQPIAAKEMPLFANVLLYGGHGVGKTVTGCRIIAPKKRGLLFALDDDWKSLKNHPDLMDSYDVMDYESVVQLPVIVEAIHERIPPYDEYDTVVIDPISTYIEDLLEYLGTNTDYTGNRARSIVKATTSEGNRFLRDFKAIAPEWPDYQVARNFLRPVISKLIKAPVNVVMTSHDRIPSEAEVDKTGDRAIRPDLPKQCNAVVVRKCDALGLMKRTGNKREITFDKTNRSDGKSRLGFLEGKTVSADELPALINDWRFNSK